MKPKLRRRIILFVVSALIALLSIIGPPHPSYACGPLGLGLSPACWGEGAGENASENLSGAIETVAKEGVTITADLDNRDIRHVFNRVDGTLSLATAQAEALSSHVSGDLKDTIDTTAAHLQDLSKVLDSIAEQRLDQLDQASEDRIRQIFDGIEQEVSHISTELSGLMIASERTVDSYLTSGANQSIRVIKTAQDELAETLKLTDASVNRLVRSTAEETKAIMSLAGAETSQLVQLSGREVRQTVRTTGDTASAVLEVLGDETRLTIDQAGAEAIAVTDNFSQELQAVVRSTNAGLQDLVQTTSDEVQEIIHVIEDSRLIVIERTSENVLYIVNRTADLVLAVMSTSAGLVFIFIASYGWGKGILRFGFPKNRIVAGVVVGFIVLTFGAAGTFLAFALSPNMRAQVLLPVSQTQTFAEANLQYPSIPHEPEIKRYRPGVVSSREDNPPSHLRLYGSNLRQLSIQAKYGDYNLPVFGFNKLIYIGLETVYEQPGHASSVEIYLDSELIVSVPVHHGQKSTHSTSSEAPDRNRAPQVPRQSASFVRSEDLKGRDYPLDRCGDANPSGSQSWYRVYVDYSPETLKKLQEKACRDARKVDDENIQVASFQSRETAHTFARMMKKYIGSGEVAGPFRS